MGFFSTPNAHVIMSSVETRAVGVTSATLATMRQTGMSISIGLATLVLALEVGRGALVPADYPGVLTTVRISFLIFTALCAAGIWASLVGPGKHDRRPGPLNLRREPRVRSDPAWGRRPEGQSRKRTRLQQ